VGHRYVNQYAAQLVAHGHNPYTRSMAPALQQFQVPISYNTFRLDGSEVTSLSYPAGSFLAYVPALWMGLSTQAANIIDVLVWLAACVLAFFFLPRRLRWIAPILAVGSSYLDYFIGGCTDAIYVPLLMLAVWRWDRFGDKTLHWAWRWTGPVALGLAMTVKQTPWFLVPFLVTGVFMEHRARTGDRIAATKTAAAHLGVTIGVFLLVNLPFLIDTPGPWLRGAVLPFADPLIPDGQGAVNAASFLGMGGGNLSLYSVAGAAFVAALGLTWILRYPTLKRAWLVLVALSFWLPTRSFTSYLIMLLPAALIAATTVREAPANWAWAPRWTGRRATALIAAGFTLVAGCLTAALASPSPLRLTIDDVRTTGQMGSVSEVTVTVSNQTGQRVTPAFSVDVGMHVTTFWYAVHPTPDGGLQATGPITLAPHQTRTVVLRAPNVSSMSGIAAPFTVNAYLDNPASVSISSKYQLSKWHVRLSPGAVNTAVPAGQKVRFTAQVYDMFGRPVHQAGIALVIGQTVYAQQGLMAGQASINGAPEGQSPITVHTGPDGSASITVLGSQAQRDPIYLQAWVNDADGTSSGYSNMVAVQFAGSGVASVPQQQQQSSAAPSPSAGLHPSTKGKR
jgi:uncharacterized membrane protein